MNTLNPNQRKIHQRAIEAGRHYRRCEFQLIKVLQEIDRSKIYKNLGCSSLFVYALKFLGLDESVAYSAITVARKAGEVPCLGRSLEEQKLSIAKANRIVSTLNLENAEHLVEFAERHSTAELNREVTRLRRGSGLPEKLMNLQVSEETMALIKRARSLMPDVKDLDRTLRAVLTEHLERRDPVKKAERAFRRKAGEKSATPLPKLLCTNRVPKRKPLTAGEKHAVFARDRGRCTHLDESGKRCSNERFLHIHHIRPVSQGGGNNPCNLTTLCAFHHDLAHQLSFPIEGKFTWLSSKPENNGAAM